MGKGLVSCTRTYTEDEDNMIEDTKSVLEFLHSDPSIEEMAKEFRILKGKLRRMNEASRLLKEEIMRRLGMSRDYDQTEFVDAEIEDSL